LAGRFRTDHHGLLVAQILAHIDYLDETIATLSARIQQVIGPFAEQVALLDTIPGVDQRGAEQGVAEMGIERARVGTAACRAACSGGAPGKDESAGQQRSRKTRHGNRVLRAGLTQLAHAAARPTGTYLSALYQRLAARRGQKRAIVAGAQAMVVSAFHRLSRHEPYQELGANSFDKRRRHHRVDRLARRLQRLGYQVHLELLPTPAA
jgi:transposase